MTTVDEIVSQTEDRFPISIQVLAFDNDPTSLLLLDNMLRQCHYNVTTTSDALTAMKLLRENKNKFDIVITDVDRDDMDGFKLFEIARLEMDLPVIMLSENSDTELVTKGIARGSCDNLLKPVRFEEINKICQHVVERNKFDRKAKYTSNSQDKPHVGGGEAAGVGNADHNGKLNKKQKDQNEDEDEEGDENEHDNEDPSRQKKPRVVWSEKFIREFVAAFTQLGIERNIDNNGMLNKKRIYQNEDEDEECDDNRHDNMDPSPQNKPRVVWSEELSREFVAAFNKLGIERNVDNYEKLNKKRIDQIEDDNMDQSPQNKPRVDDLGHEFVAAFNQLGIERKVGNNEDHPHSLTFGSKIWDCPPCNVCGKICNTQALECEEPKCNFIVHWKCLHEEEK